MTFAPQVVNGSDKEGGKVLRSQEVPDALSWSNLDFTSSFITTNDPSTK